MPYRYGDGHLPCHSYSRCWIHLIWSTSRRERVLHGEIAVRVSNYIAAIAESNGIYMRAIHVNSDHVHSLIDVPPTRSVDDVAKLLEGSSSRWINASGSLMGHFRWARGYGAFSVSASVLDDVIAYIEGQDEHHRVRTFAEEYEAFARRYGLASGIE